MSFVEILPWAALPGVIAGAVVGLMVAVTRGGLSRLKKRYPPVRPSPGVEMRPCGCLVVGLTRMAGGIVRIGSDDTHLHVRPATLLDDHDIGGTSIPWSAVDPATVHPRGRRNGDDLSGLRLTDGTQLVVPTWTLSRLPAGHS
ncbi:MAG: hypothetical protein AAF108_12015 [Planctomycetota bacterium]